ncbi:ATP synthase F1 subunit epsilon [Candidatus Magnetaquicoccus inordinatus]|uniref:ATP synthase F1 subunit epsilon n=1 Tax=Candidatus Magnetaquicoccus inordinatus TaxID=2496818 RepID=UPI00102B6E46|nr:ATP synthase F1 subunit epsilon [Candidatus Magnetaquicoccus inordinatus]
MAVTFQFDLVTPEKLVLSQAEVMLTVPGAEGYFGVLPGHTPLVSLLTAGVLTVGEGKEAVRYAIAGGYAEILPDRTTILADRLQCWDSVNVAAVEAEKRAASDAELASRDEESTNKFWKKRLAFAELCLDVHQQYLHRSS